MTLTEAKEKATLALREHVSAMFQLRAFAIDLMHAIVRTEEFRKDEPVRVCGGYFSCYNGILTWDIFHFGRRKRTLVGPTTPSYDPYEQLRFIEQLLGDKAERAVTPWRWSHVIDRDLLVKIYEEFRQIAKNVIETSEQIAGDESLRETLQSLRSQRVGFVNGDVFFNNGLRGCVLLDKERMIAGSHSAYDPRFSAEFLQYFLLNA